MTEEVSIPQGYLREVACRCCGKLFQQKRPWQEFCHRKCRTKFHNEINLAILRKAREEAKV